MQSQAVALIQKRAEKYGLAGNIPPHWADNLLRQGVIQRTPVHQLERLSTFSPRIRDQRDLAQAISEFHKTLRTMQEVSKRQVTSPELLFTQRAGWPELNLEVQLTAFGQRLASACGLV